MYHNSYVELSLELLDINVEYRRKSNAINLIVYYILLGIYNRPDELNMKTGFSRKAPNDLELLGSPPRTKYGSILRSLDAFEAAI